MNKIPLAIALRPKTIDEIIGQDYLIGPDSIIRKMIEADKIKSMILWGKSGVGKTTIARCIAHDTKSNFKELNATNSKIADIRKLIEEAKKDKDDGKNTIIFIDEVHRWPKNVQDALLPHVEDGIITIIGATTEKPQFAVNSALLSRVQSYQLEKLTKKDMINGLSRILRHYESNSIKITIDKKAALLLINRCSGDLRKLMASAETIIDVLLKDGRIVEEHIDAVIPSKFYYFDGTGNEHFDYAACWQNSVQNSDSDQAIYFLALWLLSGEDPVYIARRILISASEDACLNPNAALIANNAYIAAKEIGYPECKIPMAHATIEICKSPRKKIANDAINQAIYDIEHGYDIIGLGDMGAGMHDGYTKLINKKYVDKT